MNATRISTLALLLIPGLGLAAHAAPALQVTPLGYQVTQVQAVPGQSRTYDVTSRAGIANSGDPARDVSATLTSRSSQFVVIDGVVQFGDVPHASPFRPARSQDTFTIRVAVPRFMNIFELLAFMRNLHQSLSWQTSCANCGAANRPPFANAGADQSVYAQQLVTLDGSGSSDPDGDALTYAWTLLQRPAGSVAALSAAGSVQPTFTPDREGDYLVQLIVRDGSLPSAPDTVAISTRNSAPVANAGADQTAFVGLPVQLDGSGSSDVDGDAITFAWQMIQRPPGSSAVLERPDEVNPAFLPDLAGRYVIALIVDDGKIASAPDTVIVSTANSRPVANAGADLSARVGEAVQLDGSASRDPDGDPLTFRWSLSARPAGSASSLQGEGAPTPTLPIDRPGTYVAQLIVNDGTADSDADSVAISTQNSAPAAIVDGPAAVHFGSSVLLSGARSSDPDGDPLSFNWSLLSAPQGSAAALSDPFAIGPSFLADLPGTYVAQLIVGDGTTNSAPASFSIAAQNEPPVARDDAATTSTGTPVTVSVLANDSDADPEDSLRVTSVGAAAHGTVTHTAGEVTYSPAAGFAGSDEFSYRITDGAATANATVRIAVLAAPPVNQPPTAALDIIPPTVEAGAVALLSFARSGDLDAGDSVAAYRVTLRSAPAGSTGGSTGGVQLVVGVALGTTDTSIAFAPDIAGTYVFDLTAIDTHGAQSTAVSGSLTATAPPPLPNRAPVAVLRIEPATIEIGGNLATATLDFSGSTDPDAGDAVSKFVVTLLAAPAGSAGGAAAGQRFTVGMPVETTAPSLSFAPDVAGTYRFDLVVHDRSDTASSAATADLIALDPAPPGAVASVAIDKSAILLTGPGQSAQLHAQALDSLGLPAGAPVAWTSSNPADVSVDNSGRITAHRIGSALIHAEAGGQRSTPSFIIVAEPMPGALLVPDSQVVSVGLPGPLPEGATPGIGTQYEARLTGLTQVPAAGTVVIATETAQIGGIVVAVRQEGNDFVLTLALAPLYELLARYHIDWEVDLSGYPLEALAGQATQAAQSNARARRSFETLAPEDSPIQPFQAFECTGEATASLLSSEVSLTPNNALTLVIADHRDDPSLPPGYVKRALTGSMTLDGTVGVKLKANISASGECKAQKQIRIRIGGLVSLLITPAVRIGVGVSLDGTLTVATGEISATGRVGTSQTLGWECGGDGTCHALDNIEAINEFKFTLLAPSIHGMHVDAGAHAFVLLGLDLVFLDFLDAGTASIVEARLGPKQSIDLGRMEDQAENESYASNYDLKVEGSVKPGAALAAAIKKSIDSDTVSVNFKGTFELPPKYESPRGTLEVSRSRVPLGEGVDFTVRLGGGTTSYAVVGYNVAGIQLWRKRADDFEFEFWQAIPVSASNQDTFTYHWQPTGEDIGSNEFAAFVTTIIPVEPYLEIAADSRQEIVVACFSGGAPANSPQPASGVGLLATNTCANAWSGTASVVANGAAGFESTLVWTPDPTFDEEANPGLARYRATGTTTIRHILWNDLGCTVEPTVVNFSADSSPQEENNMLIVDYSTTPNTYSILASKTVPGEVICPGADPMPVAIPVTAVSNGGNVSDDGALIQASGQTPQGSYSYSFSRP